MPATRRRACSVRAYYTHVVGLVPFVDRLNQEINYWLAIVAGSLSSDGLGDEVNIGRAFEAGSLSVRAYYTHVAGLISFVPL